MNNLNIDKSQVALRFAKAGQSYVEHAVIQKKIAQNLYELIEQFCPKQVGKTFEIGCGSGNLSHLLIEQFQSEQWIFNDLYKDVQVHFVERNNVEWLIGDVENLPLPQEIDLLVSSSALQWIVDLDALLKKAYLSLKPNAFFCFSSFGQQNLQEIKNLTGQGLDYLSLDDLKNKLHQQGFEILYLSEQTERLSFSHPKQILQHLKATGVTATASKFRWTKQSLFDFYQAYQQFLYSDELGQQHYSLTYHPIYCIARRMP